MSLLAMTSRTGRIGAVLGTALGIATMTTAAKPADAHMSVWFGAGAPAYSPSPYYYPPRAYWYGRPYAQGYQRFGFYRGDRDHFWRHRHWRDRDDWDDRD